VNNDDVTQTKTFSASFQNSISKQGCECLETFYLQNSIFENVFLSLSSSE
jgi:hypothetical protein